MPNRYTKSYIARLARRHAGGGPADRLRHAAGAGGHPAGGLAAGAAVPGLHERVARALAAGRRHELAAGGALH